MDHKCFKENTIKDLKNTLYGNGRKGMVREFEILKTTVQVMDERSKKIETSLSGISKFVGTVETEIDNIKANSIQKRQSTAQIITQILMVFGIIASIIIGLLK